MSGSGGCEWRSSPRIKPLKQVATDALRPPRFCSPSNSRRNPVAISDCPAPSIAVCGLNPHAGEGGQMGDEEQTTIGPNCF